uniref:Uncharacterized protein n=1 Tax=Chenopodium quinoa TaxID=63459 RepID=A0A803MIQ0_CHEQI
MSLEVDNVKLYVSGIGFELKSRLDHWLDGAVRRRVKELELEIGVQECPRYSFPESGLVANSITKLKLRKCENVTLMNCDGLRTLEISSLTKLEKVTFGKSACLTVNVELIKVDAPNLLEFRELVKIIFSTPNLKFFTYMGEDPIPLVYKGPALKLTDACLRLKSVLKNEYWFVSNGDAVLI